MVLILIYVMVVGWFKSFIVPLVIMAPIPLSLIGILPGHALMGAFFTATSMIGFIAGAGIVVRNSIILVDFVDLKIAEGCPDQGSGHPGRPHPLSAHAPHRRRRGGRLFGHPLRPYLPGHGHRPHVRRSGGATLLSRTMVPVLCYLFRAREAKKLLKCDLEVKPQDPGRENAPPE